MALLPVEFRKFAEFLERSEKVPSYLTPACKRTVVSRYYYYAFLELREIFFTKLSINSKKELRKEETRKVIHRLIQEILFELGFKRTCSKLAKLRSLRNFCDYELRANEEDALRKARLLLQEIEKMFPLLYKIPDSEVEKVFVKVLRRIIL